MITKIDSSNEECDLKIAKYQNKKNILLKNEDYFFEKKKWISITGLCNNNCLFCLDGWRKDRYHKKKELILNEIKRARDEGCTKLILSGGEPTIHPDIIYLIRYGKKNGFRKIQIISNGRMFSDNEFTEKIIKAGLDEITFSIHGYNSKIHDNLTRVPGSFKQTIVGIKNVFSNPQKIIVNTDTCITKLNYKHLLETIKFIVERLTIKEVNLMNLVPHGNTWKYKERVLCDYEEAAPHIHNVIDYCTKKGVILWLSRFPPEYLEGYEEFIEDSYKLIDDVRARIEYLRDTTNPICKGDRCTYCCIKNICNDFIKINLKPIIIDKQQKKIYDYKITASIKNCKKISDIINIKNNKRILIKLVEPSKKLNNYKNIAPRMEHIISFLKKIDHSTCHIDITGVPTCTLINAGIKNIKSVNYKDIKYSIYNQSGRKNYFALAEELARKVKIKSIKCRSCDFYDECPGLYQNYVRLFGFGKIKPVKGENNGS